MTWLRRKWCEWSHVHSWWAIKLINPDTYHVLMECRICRRHWERSDDPNLS